MTEDELILTHILQCPPIDLVLKKPALTLTQQEQFENYRHRREAGEPLQYILGTCNFMGLELAVNPSVLIPRPETEQLVDAAIKYLRMASLSGFPIETFGNDKVRVLDLGTGSGNIAIALAKFVPQSQIVAVDISAQALEVAKINARKHKVEDRIEFIQKDLNEYLASVTPECFSRGSSSSVSGFPIEVTAFGGIPSRGGTFGNDKFDLIISNPPYIPTSQLRILPRDVQQEPAIALDGGEDGLKFSRIIIKYTPCLLRGGACLMMEFGDGQAEAIKKLVEAQKAFSEIEIIKDLTGRDRIIKGS